MLWDDHLTSFIFSLMLKTYWIIQRRTKKYEDYNQHISNAYYPFLLRLYIMFFYYKTKKYNVCYASITQALNLLISKPVSLYSNQYLKK